MALSNSVAFVRQTFCERTFQFPKGRWSDVVCLMPMSKSRVARIELTDPHTSDHYAQLVVKIVHTEHGEIDRKGFAFADWLDEREDDRNDLPNQRPYIWRGGGRGAEFDWYIAVPSKRAIKKLCDAIVDYIKAFE